MLHRALFAVLFMMLVGGCSLEQELVPNTQDGGGAGSADAGRDSARSIT